LKQAIIKAGHDGQDFPTSAAPDNQVKLISQEL